MTFYDAALLMGKDPEKLIQGYCPGKLAEGFLGKGTIRLKTRLCEQEFGDHGCGKHSHGGEALTRRCWNQHIEDHDPEFVAKFDQVYRSSAIICD